MPSSLVILATAVVAVLTLRYLQLLKVGPHDRPRHRIQTVLIIVVLLCTALVIAGLDTAAGRVPSSFRATVVRNLGSIDEIIASKTAAAGDIPHSYFPASVADRLRGGLPTVAGVVGAIVEPAAFPNRVSGHPTAHGAILGLPADYPPAFGPLTTVQGKLVTLGQLDANQVYINQAAARALGVNAGDQLEPLVGGQSLSPGPTMLYFAAGNTGRIQANGGPRFAETLILRNNSPFPTTATLTYLIQDAHPVVVFRKIPRHGTLRESVESDVGPNRAVATIISSPAQLTAQRIVYILDAGGSVIESMRSPAMTARGTRLSFAADGTTDSDQVSVVLANPGAAAAQASVTLLSHLGTFTQSVTVPARGRTAVGFDHPSGTLSVTSNLPIVAEKVRHVPPSGIGWGITPGVAANGSTGVALYAPIVRAVLLDQGLAAGGLLSGGTQSTPLVLVPLRRLQGVIGQPGQITTVLISNRGDPLAGVPLTGQVAGIAQSQLASTAAATAIKLTLIMPHGLAAMHALEQDPRFDVNTQNKLAGVMNELGVPGTSNRLKGLLNDRSVIAALRTITDPAVTQTLDPALSALSPYTLQPIKQDALAQADQGSLAVLARYQDWSQTAFLAGILLSVLLVLLLPIQRRAGVARRYVFDLGVIVLCLILGTAVGRGVSPLVAARVNANPASQLQTNALDVGAGATEVVITVLRHPIRTLAPTSTPTETSTSTSTPTATPTSTSTATDTPTSTDTPTHTPTKPPTRTPKPEKSPVRTPTSTAVATTAPTTAPPAAATLTATVPATVTPGTTIEASTTPTGTASTPASATPLTSTTPITTAPATATVAVIVPARATATSTALPTKAPTATARPTRAPTKTARPTKAPTHTPVPTRVSAHAGAIAINAGGWAVGGFKADMDANGGTTGFHPHPINTSGVTDPAPPAVYQTLRYGDFTYTVPNLTPGARYLVRLHFAETYWQAAGKRVFNVAINNVPVLHHFDIYAASGGADTAIVKSFTATSSSDGVISIAFISVVDNASVSGIEIIPEPRDYP